ncbi:MAG: bifunctional phosphoribosylaminoimidazolecarboxamide formyltransferase/IMP cyclohydrolase, partial [Dehalococcoidia bacterium]
RYLSEDRESLPAEFTLGMRKLQDLRYGENPHQQGAFYTDVLEGGVGVAGARKLWGKELSFNNIVDADAAWKVVTDFDETAVAIIKHTNPCGLACNDDLAEAYRRALAGDPVSAFGGVVASNRPLTRAAVEEISKVFYEIVIAPDFDGEALGLLKRKKYLRILAVASDSGEGGLDFRPVGGGVLLQTPDSIAEDPSRWKIVTKRKPTTEELRDLAFAWRAVKHVKSNAIVLAKERAVVGMGAGQPNRVTSVHLAIRAAGERAKGSVLASDAFFPFADNVELAAEGGVTAVVQPGGSIRDKEVIAAADARGLAMLFTGIRHFKH